MLIERDTKELSRYQAFLEFKRAIAPPTQGDFATYEDEKGATYDGHWLPYVELRQEAGMAIPNAINELTRYIHDLRAWDKATQGLGEDDLFEIAIAFVDQLATVAMNLPYVIQQRMLYAVAHLCHLANRTKIGSAWVDDLPEDRKINGAICDKYGNGWVAFPTFRRAVNLLNDVGYQADTEYFRERYTHRLPPRVLYGMHSMYSREKLPKGAEYGLGGRQAMPIAKVVTALERQRNLALPALEAYRAIVDEQMALVKPRK
ncbi:MAG: hypothetical protein KGM46_04875 [Pseudomonadota bacterium]|jgi:hypothetical protein|nr:hypothetical protein [Xanthomonadaceae bacterium]MDE2249500.1 hypothetical protein [Xanthomonadaceae bacterium]MDE3210054.1 hypothetical protein [Pseudomonadota bacterium]